MLEHGNSEQLIIKRYISQNFYCENAVPMRPRPITPLVVRIPSIYMHYSLGTESLYFCERVVSKIISNYMQGLIFSESTLSYC